MNSTEKKYAMDRISQIVRAEESEITNSYDWPDFSITAKIKLIKAGKVEVKPQSGQYRIKSSIDDIFDFSPYETKERVIQAKLDAEIAKLRKKAQKVKDEIMLGDEKRALELLRAFEETK